ncbi:MAG: hypothetical protein ABIJ65_01175 [Chloroflexota bacterium]
MSTIEPQEPIITASEPIGSPFQTGLLVGGLPTFVFMFIGGILAIPTALGFPLNVSVFPCLMLFIAIGAAYATSKWVKSYAVRRNLAPASTLASGIGGIVGGFAGTMVIVIFIAALWLI